MKTSTKDNNYLIIPKPVKPTKKDKYYLGIAEKVARGSTCRRRNFGAVIVNHDQIISTGYGGAPKKTLHCTWNRIGYCYRDRMGARSGENYEFCRAVHAEQNAMIQAPGLEMLNGVLYLVGLDAKTKEPYSNTEPCRICKRQIINAEIRLVICLQGRNKVRKYLVKDWVNNNLWEFRKEEGSFIPEEPPRTLIEPIDKEIANRLVSQFSLDDAIVVNTASYEIGKHAVARVAARHFSDNVETGQSVAISCGDTVLSMIQSLPNRPTRKLNIHQLSIENDPKMIHQAPATLVGLLRTKCSPDSEVFGLQLPPLDLVDSSVSERKNLLQNKIIKQIRKDALKSDYIFLGLGSAKSDSASFWAMAMAATKGKFPKLVNELGIVGEINNQVFNRSGEDCTYLIPEFEKQALNIVTLTDIKKMAAKNTKQKVVMIATGPSKAEGLRVALKSRFLNVLITGREDADRLLDS